MAQVNRIPRLWMQSLRDSMGQIDSAKPGHYALLAVALVAVSSAGAVLQQMEGVPPLLKASWRMYGTSIVLIPVSYTHLTLPTSIQV